MNKKYGEVVTNGMAGGPAVYGGQIHERSPSEEQVLSILVFTGLEREGGVSGLGLGWMMG